MRAGKLYKLIPRRVMGYSHSRINGQIHQTYLVTGITLRDALNMDELLDRETPILCVESTGDDWITVLIGGKLSLLGLKHRRHFKRVPDSPT